MSDWPPKKNAAFTVTFPIYDADGDLVTAAATLDSEVSKDGGTFTDCTNEASEIATSSGIYTLALTATEMNADIVATITKTGTAGAKTAVNVMYTVTRQIIDLAFPTTTGRSMDVTATGAVGVDFDNIEGTLDAAEIGTGAITAAKFAAGAIDASAIATDAIGSDELAATAIAEIADGVWDEAMSGHNTLGTYGQAFNGLVPIRGAVNDAGATAADFDTDGFTEASDNHFNGSVMVFTTGALTGQARIISTYTGVGQNCAFNRNWTEAPANNDEFVILGPLAGGLSRLIATESDGHAHADLKEWLGSAPNALQTGRVDSYVGAMAAAVLTAAAIATDAITAAAIAADAIGASELAADAATEIADAILSRDVDNVEATAPVHSLCVAILKAVSRIRDNAGTLEVYRTDGTTLKMSQTVTTDAALDPVDELSIGS